MALTRKYKYALALANLEILAAYMNSFLALLHKKYLKTFMKVQRKREIIGNPSQNIKIFVLHKTIARAIRQTKVQ